MLLEGLRKEIVEYGIQMFDSGLTQGTGGYISARDPETGYICSTPSSMPYHDIKPENVLVTDVEGNIIEGIGKISSEWCVQRAVYKMRSDINALVHAHSKFATTLATLQMDLPVSFFSLSQCGGADVKCTGYYDFYSQELADDIFDKMNGRMACLMGNHGMLAAGTTLKEAYSNADVLEFSAEIYWRAKCIGQPYVLNQQEIEEIQASLYRYTHINDDLK